MEMVAITAGCGLSASEHALNVIENDPKHPMFEGQNDPFSTPFIYKEKTPNPT
jgi:hypothetical protein